MGSVRFIFALLVAVLSSGPVHAEGHAEVTSAAAAGAPARPAVDGGQHEARPSEVRLGDRVLLRLEEARAGVSAQARAQTATAALGRLLHSGEEHSVRLRWLQAGGTADSAARIAQISVGGTVVLELSQRDLGTVDDPSAGDVAAQRIATRLEEAIAEEAHRTEIATWVLSGSSVVFLGLVALLLLRAAGRWSRFAIAWSHREADSIRPVQVGSLELIPAGAVREGLRVGVLGGVWLLRVAIVYVWAIWSLSLFEATRGLAESATGTLLRPLVELLGRVASRIPLVVALLVSLLFVALLMRFVAAYFRGVERGDIESEWVEPATARVTGGLLLIALGVATLLFVAPLVTGASDGVLPQLGMLSLAVLAFSTAPLLVSCALGVRLVYSRALRLGDDLEYGGQRGRVQQIGLFDAVLLPPEGGIVRVPHLMSLWNVTRVYPELSSDVALAQTEDGETS